MAAVSSIVHNKILKRYFNRLKEIGKPGKTSIVALERKLLILIYTLDKNQQTFQTDYQQASLQESSPINGLQ